MWSAIGSVLGGLVAPITSYFQRKRELTLEEHKAALELVRAQGERAADLVKQGLAADMQWEEAMVAQAATGWKDELTFAVVFAPLVLCFVKVGSFDGPAIVAAGFAAIEANIPDFWILLATTIGFANYGIRSWRRSQYDTEGPAAPNP